MVTDEVVPLREQLRRHRRHAHERPPRARPTTAAQEQLQAVQDALQQQGLVLAQQAQLQTQLLQMIAARAAPEPRAARAPEIKLHGVRALKGDSGEELDGWVAQLDATRDVYVVHRRRGGRVFVAHAATTLEGAAAVWWDVWRQTARPATWPDMVAA